MRIEEVSENGSKGILVFVELLPQSKIKGTGNSLNVCSPDISTLWSPRSVDIGDIDPHLKSETVRQKIRDEYISDATVTVVLIGRHTWQRNMWIGRYLPVYGILKIILVADCWESLFLPITRPAIARISKDILEKDIGLKIDDYSSDANPPKGRFGNIFGNRSIRIY